MNSRNHRDAEVAGKDLKDKEKGRFGEIGEERCASMLGEAQAHPSIDYNVDGAASRDTSCSQL